MSIEKTIQRRYYRNTARQYDRLHLGEPEHELALSVLVGLIDHYQIKSVLDLGSGTGRVLRRIKRDRPGVEVLGIEPVEELREVAYAKGIGRHELIAGDGTALGIPSQSFDLVCEFGVLHHIKRPELAVAEMLRIARRYVFISDANNFGQGSAPARLAKQLLHRTGLWGLADRIKTKGTGYTISSTDGLAYSYSVFDNYRQIRRACSAVHVLNTVDGGINPYRSAPQVALLGIKQ